MTADTLSTSERALLDMLRNPAEGHRQIVISIWRGLPQDGSDAQRWSVSVYDKCHKTGRGESLDTA